MQALKRSVFRENNHDLNNQNPDHPSARISYSVLEMRLMTYLALMAYNSGWYRHALQNSTAKGVKLLDAYDFYGKFYGGPHSGYYQYENDRTPTNMAGANAGPLWEVANLAVPGNTEVGKVITAMDSQTSETFDPEGPGHTGALLFRN